MSSFTESRHTAITKGAEQPAVFEKAEDLGREHGAGSIRIDTHPDNRIMQNWLKKNGFPTVDGSGL